MANLEWIITLGTIFAIAATVLAYIFIVPDKKAAGKKGIVKLLHDIFNFKFLIVEKIFQALYIFATAYAVCGGFFMLFAVERWYSYYSGYRYEWVGYYGLIMMILGPIAIRIVYEFIMMAILLVKNVIQINNKLKNQNEGEAGDIFASNFKSVVGNSAPVEQPVYQQTYQPVEQPVYQQAAQPVASFCPNCGSMANPDGTCPNCRY